MDSGLLSGCLDGGGHLVVCNYNNNVSYTRPSAAGEWGLPAYNVTKNQTTFSKTPGVDIIWQTLAMFYTPTLTSVGVSGNVLMSAILISSRLQRNSAHHYLAAAMLADAVYLSGLLLLWLEQVDMDLYNRKGWCQFISFINRVSSFLSLWLMVAFSVDRLAVHAWPRRAAQLCTPFRAKLVVLALVVVAVVVFVNISLTVGVVTHDGVARCVPLLRFVRQLRHLDLVDSLFNIAMPYITMIVIWGLLIKYLIALRRQLDDPLTHGVIECNQQESIYQTRPYRLSVFSMTLLLLFLILRVPSDALRLVHSLRNALNNFSPMPWAGVVLMQGLAPAFHASFAIKPCIVVTCHPDVRRGLTKVMAKLSLCCCARKVKNVPSLEEGERENNNGQPHEL